MSDITVVNVKKKYLNMRGFEDFDDWNADPDHLYIGRSMQWVKGCTTANKSKWSNPFPAKTYGRKKCLKLYRDYIFNHETLYDQLEELLYKELGCWCAPEECHGDVLVQLLSDKLAFS